MNNENRLREQDVYVQKIGGENASDFEENIGNLSSYAKEKKHVLVLSAIRSSDSLYTKFSDPSVLREGETGFNTTSHLIVLSERLEKGDVQGALEIVHRIDIFLKALIQQKLPQKEESFKKIINSKISLLRDNIQNFEANDRILKLKTDFLIQKKEGNLFSITGWGENLSRDLYGHYCQEEGIAAKAVPWEDEFESVFQNIPPEAVVQNKKEANEALKILTERVREKVNSTLEDVNIVLSGGYAPVLSCERGYSDMMAALIANIVEKSTLIIAKQSPILSADPHRMPQKLVDRLRVVQNMGYPLAQEIFGSRHGAAAGAIQEGAMKILSEAEEPVDIFVLNPQDIHPEKITRISPEEFNPNGIEIITVKKGSYFLRISSPFMGHPGRSAIFADWFNQQGISFDNCTTSESIIEYTFSQEEMDNQKKEELESFLKREYPGEFELTGKSNIALLYCCGNNLQSPGVASKITTALSLAGIDIQMISQTTSEQVMIVGVDEDQAQKALKYIHRYTIEMGDMEYQNLIEPLREASYDLEKTEEDDH